MCDNCKSLSSCPLFKYPEFIKKEFCVLPMLEVNKEIFIDADVIEPICNSNLKQLPGGDIPFIEIE